MLSMTDQDDLNIDGLLHELEVAEAKDAHVSQWKVFGSLFILRLNLQNSSNSTTCFVLHSNKCDTMILVLILL